MCQIKNTEWLFIFKRLVHLRFGQLVSNYSDDKKVIKQQKLPNFSHRH